MRFVIKQVRPCGELWLVRMSARGIWGGQERARTFLNRAAAQACLKKLRPSPDASLEIAPLEVAANGHSIKFGEDLLSALPGQGAAIGPKFGTQLIKAPVKV
jgi:hypothetical protein